NTSLIASGFLSLLLLVPNPIGGRVAVLFVCGFVFTVGMVLRRASKKHAKADESEMSPKSESNAIS
ncbi:MAG: hypothetical protein ACI92G_004020, partial [Candidatus Pelagisphaera sp.]